MIDRIEVDADGNTVIHGSHPAVSWPIIVVNPPEMVPDGDGLRHDPEEAIRQVVADVIRDATG